MNIMLYKCPGFHRYSGDMTYQYKVAKSEDEKKALIADDWYEDIHEAAKYCTGPDSLKKKPKEPKGVNKYAKGLPYVAPAVIAEEPQEVEEPKDKPGTVSDTPAEDAQTEVAEDKPRFQVGKPKLNNDQKREIVYLLGEGHRLKDIAEKYDVSMSTISNIKKKNGL